MSVVAGVSLLDGILIGADCRMTYESGRTKTYRDELQKIIPIGTHTVIGFVGWVPTAANLLLSMLEARDGRREAVELEQWLPRYFEYHFAKIKNAQPVSFVVGSVVPGRPNIVAKSAIAKVVFDAVNSRPAGGINTISRTFLDMLNMPTDSVAVSGAGEGHLYAMKSPKFIPTHYKPLQSIAIGSGQNMQEQILQIADQLHFDTHGANPDVTWFGRSLNHYLRVSDELTVGGMFTIAKITAAQGIQCFGRTTVDLTNKVAYELAIEGVNNRWVQRNLTTGKSIELIMPWEVDNKLQKDNRFDDLRPKPLPPNE